MKRVLKLLICLVAFLITVSPLKINSVSAEKSYSDMQNLGNFNAFWTNWEGVENTPLASGASETYKVSDRHWAGLPSVCLTEGGRLWCGFMTGGADEPDPLNYNAFHYSDDGGVTWSEESLVIDHVDETKGIYQPHIFMVDGVMHIWLNHGGQNVIKVDNPDCENPSENLHLTKATKVLNYNAAHRPLQLSDKWENIWLFSAENSTSPQNMIFASTNAMKWEHYSSITSTNGNRNWWEGQVCETADGTLIFSTRIENGADNGIQLAYSYDGAETWTNCEANNGLPFVAYCNKSHMQLLDSGNLIFIVASSDKARENLTVYLSEDNGKTWPYSLSLDSRYHLGNWFGCGYPEAANLQGENGEIYIVWDARISFNEIGCAKITEADIKAGKIVTQGCYTYNNVNRNANFLGSVADDLDGRTTQIEEIKVKKGTTLAEVQAQLPSSVTAIHNDQQITMTGMWVCPNYFNGEKAGRYTFRFDTPDLPYNTGDSYGYLTVNVWVEDDSSVIGGGGEEGCKSSVSCTMPMLALLGISALKIIKDKEKQNEK